MINNFNLENKTLLIRARTGENAAPTTDLDTMKLSKQTMVEAPIGRKAFTMKRERKRSTLSL